MSRRRLNEIALALLLAGGALLLLPTGGGDGEGG